MAKGQGRLKELSLGEQVHRMLVERGIETPMRAYNNRNAYGHVFNAFADILREGLNLDIDDDSLKDTPARVARMYTQEVFWGLNYDNFPKCTVIENKFRYDEMIACTCTVKSMCEHHFVPFIGIAHVAYIPKTKVLGLSKFNRVVDFFSRRPQVQERLTAQIQRTLEYILGTADVAVVVKARHYCVHLRGVEDSNSETITSAMGGKFFKVPTLRNEFLSLTRNGNGNS